MASVAEVGRPPGLTRVPGLPGWVAGLANWRGRVLAVLDLRTLLGAPADDLGRSGRIVVLAHGAVSAGLLVEEVQGTELIDLQAVEPLLAGLSERSRTVLAGQVTDADGPLRGARRRRRLRARGGAAPRPARRLSGHGRRVADPTARHVLRRRLQDP